MAWKEQSILQNRSLYAICENIAEVSSQYLVQLQEISGIPRNAIIVNYIIPWAVDAENAYSAMSDNERDNIPYYDFIDTFTARKIQDAFGEDALSGCQPIAVVFKQ